MTKRVLKRKIREAGTGTITDKGYVIVSIDGIDRLEHALVAERALGKPLPKGAVVHHRDGNTSNNSPWNLIVFRNNVDHMEFHRRERAYDDCGHANWLKCPYCHQYEDPKNLYVFKNQGYHRECRRSYVWNRRHANKKLEKEMNIRFSLSNGDRFIAIAPEGSDLECYQLPKDACRFEFWRAKTGDSRIVGHTLTWEVVQ